MPTNNGFPLRLASLVALLIGVLLVVQGILGIVAPDVFVGSIRFIQTPPVMYVAAALRVVFGVVLVCAAPGSRAPRFLRGFGFIIVIGGLLTPFVGVGPPNTSLVGGRPVDLH